MEMKLRKSLITSYQATKGSEVVAQELNEAIDKIKDILSDEQGAAKIAEIISSLGGSSKKASGGPEIDNSKIDTIMKITKIYDKVANTEDPRINLLMALKPYLAKKRLNRLDSAIQMVQLTKLGSVINEIDKA